MGEVGWWLAEIKIKALSVQLKLKLPTGAQKNKFY
jgi:hypothetical protein